MLVAAHLQHAQGLRQDPAILVRHHAGALRQRHDFRGGVQLAGVVAQAQQGLVLRILAALQSASTFSLITVAWVFFRASSVDDATTLLRRAFDWSAFDAFGMSSVELMVAAGLIVGLCAVEWLQPTDDVRDLVTDSPAWVRWPVYYAVLAVMLVLGIFTRSQFTYFQF